MATFPNISDNEMNYFQFKARQLLLLKRENQEWQEYCKQVAPECPECSVGKAESQSSKSIGIQVSPRRPTSGIRKQPVVSQNQNKELPQALNSIKIKLENIDLALSKMYDSSGERKEDYELKKTSLQENKYEAEHVHAHENLSEHASRSFEEKRKLLIQNSLKASLEKMHNIYPNKPKRPITAIKKKDSGYFLPHDLQVKRAAARKAYLVSLKTSQIKPKTVAVNFQQASKKNGQSNLPEKYVPKLHLKSKKKIALKPVKSNAVNEETLVKATEIDEYKDENIEYVVDGILDDLIGETVLDLSRIRHLRAEKQVLSSFSKRLSEGYKETPAADNLSSTFIVKDTIPKTLRNDTSHLLKLKLFLDSPEYLQRRNRDMSEKYENNYESCASNGNLEEIGETIEKTLSKDVSTPKQYEIDVDPKFVCGVKHIISVNPAKAKKISLHKERFWKYLQDISRTTKGMCNPWIFCNVIIESILDDCIQDIAEELSNVSSTIIKDLYNQEFVKQVECHSIKKM